MLSERDLLDGEGASTAHGLALCVASSLPSPAPPGPSPPVALCFHLPTATVGADFRKNSGSGFLENLLWMRGMEQGPNQWVGLGVLAQPPPLSWGPLPRSSPLRPPGPHPFLLPLHSCPT